MQGRAKTHAHIKLTSTLENSVDLRLDQQLGMLRVDAFQFYSHLLVIRYIGA